MRTCLAQQVHKVHTNKTPRCACCDRDSLMIDSLCDLEASPSDSGKVHVPGAVFQTQHA